MAGIRRSRHQLLLACIIAAGAAACDSTTAPAPGPRPTVQITVPGLQLQVGQTTVLSTTVTGASDPAVDWRSSAPGIVSITAQGEARGIAPGTATITALLRSDTTARASVSVSVVPASAPPAVVMPVLGLGAVAERYTAEVAVRGGWAYTSTWSNRLAPGNVVKIWNVTGNVPVLTDSLVIPGAQTTGDVQLSDDGALLVVATEFQPGSIVIYDLANPVKPALLSTFAAPSTQPGVHTVKLGRVNGRHYAFLSVDPSPARLVIVDITDPRAPVQVWTQNMGRPYVHDVFVRDGILFAALWDDGLRIFDIGGGGRGGSPAAPVVMGNVLTATGDIHNVWWFHDPQSGAKRYAFLGEEGRGSVGGNTASGDIHVIDVSNLTNPREVAIFNVPDAGTHNFWMDEPRGILYAAYYNGGVRAIDVRGDLSACTAAQRTPAGLCDLRAMGREAGIALASGSFVWGVVYQDGHVYASDMKAGLYKLDASGLAR